MSNDQNWNNPQQNWNQPPAPAPQPPKKRMKWMIIIAVSVTIVVASLFYLASFLGKKFTETIGKINKEEIEQRDKRQETQTLRTYAEVADLINTDINLSDSLRLRFTQNLSDLKKMADDARALIKTYGNGFTDTLADQTAISALDKKWGYAYFIRSGRAAKLKNALLKLKQNAFAALPAEARDSSALELFEVYSNEEDVPDYLNQFISWENIHFNQPSRDVHKSLSKFRWQISDFEETVLAQYEQYVTGN